MTLEPGTAVDLVRAQAGGSRPPLPVRQLAAIDAFHQARRMAEKAAATAAGSREARLDAARRLDVVRRQHAAVISRTDVSLRAGREVVYATRPRAVVVHRSDWFGRAIARALAEQGFHLLAQLDNGADAVGAAVAEQPDLLLLEDPLSMMTGEQVVTEVRRYSPDTVVAVQTSDSRAMATLLDAGAGSVFSRQVAPLDVARDLAALLGAQPLVHA